MSVTVNDVKHIANLCRLNVPDDEMDKFVEQFNQILNYAEILKKVDTSMDKIQAPLDTVVRLSHSVDKVQDKTEEALGKVSDF